MRGEEGQGMERKGKAKRAEDGGRNGGKPIQGKTSNKVHSRRKGMSMQEGGLYRLDSDPGAHRNGSFLGLDSDICAHISDKILL